MVKKEYGSRKKFHYIYRVTNLVNQKYYFGMHSTNDLEDGYLGSGTYVRRSIVKYGKENFRLEILEFCSSREDLITREKEVITLHEVAKKECMNLKPGGQGGFVNSEHAYNFHAAGGKATRRLLGARHVEKLKSDKIYSEACKIKVKKGLIDAGFAEGTFKGRKHTPETIELMKKAKQETGKGINNSQYGTCWITKEIESKKIYKGDLIPEGWRLGRKVKLS